MKKLLIILLVLCTAVFAQKPKLLISVSGEVEIDIADVLMDGISYGLKNNDKYQVLINDRQFKETLKKEWQKGNIKDDRIIALAKNAGADYLCFTKIKSVKELKGKQVTAQVYDLDAMSYTSEMGMKTIKSDFSDLEDLTNIILSVVDDMLGTVKGSSGGGGNSKTLTDSRDGKKYKIVTIGNQTWMAENLNYYVSGSKCYDDSESNCKRFGRLYSWATAKYVCPSGWLLPSREDWRELENFVGGEKIISKKLKATNGGWNNTDEGYNGNGTDDYGFSALPGGNSFGDNFRDVGYGGYWWSSTESANTSGNAYPQFIRDDEDDVVGSSGPKSGLCSVRCLMD